jgi:Tol biopolymer transport system component
MTLMRTLMVASVLVAPLASQSTAPAPSYQERDFLSRVRRLTIEGKRAGEGYWAPDGKRLVFQSEREPGNPFYQIYVLDLASGDTKRISPGLGKTTCAFFRPGSDEIEFASTHADPKSKQYQDEELAFRATGKERRYSWDYDTEMDIWTYSEKTGALKRLTTAKGYDAEGSYSPDGQWIVFTSMRDAYNHPLNDKGRRSSRRIRVTRRDLPDARRGSGQKRLTNVPATTADRISRPTASASSGGA